MGILALTAIAMPNNTNRNDTNGSISWQPAPVFAQSCPPDAIDRFGVNVALEGGPIGDYAVDQLNLGWYMNYFYRKSPGSPPGLEYARMIRTRDVGNLDSVIGPIVDANPGMLWLAGNEPDRSGQDGVTAEEYAVFYHDVYTFIKSRDSSASVALGGLVMPTKLRQKYLDRVVAEYQRRYGQRPPADVLHVHGFIMSEVVFPQGDQLFWGAGVPPGMDGNDPAIEYVAPKDHWDIDILKSNLVSFRRWMADNGYRNKPLIVSEYGILLEDGWDQNGVGTANFMTSSFDLFLDQTNSSTGLSSDGNRLVQKFSWFSLNFPNDDPTQGTLNGTLFVPNTNQLTSLGRAYKGYTEDLIQTCNIAPTPVPQLKGDVNCSNNVNAVDALFVLQHTVGFRSDGGSCPLSDPDDELNASAGDVNNRNGANAVDALFILQCVVGVPNVFCGGIAAADTAPAGAVEFSTIHNEETISVEVDTGDVNIASGTFELTYDSSKARVTACTLSHEGTCNTETSGIVRFSFIDVNGISGHQPIAELTFDSTSTDINEFSATGLANNRGKGLEYSLLLDQESQLDTLEQIFVPLISR